MQVLSQSTICFQMQAKVKGLSSPLHKSLPKPTCFTHTTNFTSALLSIQLPTRSKSANVSTVSFFGASKNLSPLFHKDNGVFFKGSLNGGYAYNPATAPVASSDAERENEKLAQGNGIFFKGSLNGGYAYNLATAPVVSLDAERENEKLAQVSKRLERTGMYFKQLGGLGFWSQLVCTVVSAVILAFSLVITGKPTSPPTFYMTAGGIVAAFLSVFWSFGYIRLSERLRKNANDPAKAPPRAEVVKTLKNGIIINILGMGATVLGIQATVGVLVAKALTSSANPYYQGISPGYSPVLALDVFLVQACGNTILSHFLGLVFSLELLRSVALPQPPETATPKAA